MFRCPHLEHRGDVDTCLVCAAKRSVSNQRVLMHCVNAQTAPMDALSLRVAAKQVPHLPQARERT